MISLGLALAFAAASEWSLRSPQRNSLSTEILGVFVGNVNWLDLGLGLKRLDETGEGWGRERVGERVISVI